MLDRLRVRYGSDLRVLDARSARPGAALEALVAVPDGGAAGRWTTPVAVSSSLSLLLALSD